MADVKEQLNQNEIGERRNARRAKYVDAVGQYFAGEVQKTNLAQQKRLEQIKKKIGSLRDRDLSSLLRKLTFDESQRLTSKDSIQEIELKLSEIAKDIEKITSASELNVAEREIKKIEALIARLEKGGNTPNILERIKGLRRNKVVYMISELYRADTKLVDDTNIRGKQIFLLSKIDGLLQGPPSITIDQLLQDRQIANELENNISDFLKEYYNARKEKVNPKELSPDTIAKIPEQKRQLQKEKERYRRSAQLHALFEKIQNVKIGDEKQTYSALDLQRFIKQLEAHYNDIITSKEEHLKEINTKIDLQKIHDLISQLKSIVDELKSYLTPISDTSQRKKILETGYQKIQSALKSRTEEPQPVQVGERKNIETVNEFLIETDYEAQIDSRIETSLKVDGTREFIRGFEEFSEAHMREYEQMRKIEREGTLQQKETMAKAFIKSRLMDEFADTEKVKLLYGTSYRRMWEKNSSPDITSSQYDEIKEKLRTEVNEMFGLDEPQLDDKSKGLKTKLEVIIEKHFENQVVAEKAAQDFDKTDDEKKKDYNNAIKADLVIAFQNSGRSNPDIDLKIDELFTPESDKLPAFELLPTPNGVAVVFEPGKLEILKEFIFGQNPEGTAPETLAFTLKNNKSFKAIVEREIGVDWKGELMFISSDSDEYTMMHETQHAINHRLTANDSAESANMIDPSIKKFNLAVEEIATRFSSGEVWRELAYPQDENTKKINLSLMGLGYITPDMNVDANKENMLALYKFVETAKEIIEKEVKTFTENSLNPMDENLYGDVISEILMHNIGEDGKFDINAANIELETRFKDLITTQTQAKTSLDEADIMGVTIEDPKEKKGVIEQFKWLNDNEGFTFDIVGMKDIRGRPNVANDYYMDKNIGIEKAGKEVSSFGSILQDIPIIGTPLGEAYARRNKTNVGSTEYENNDTWIPFLFRRNYKTRNRAFGGVWRKFSHIPFLGDRNEKMTKFGASPKKMLNDLPPFGRGWEMIMQEFFASKYGKGIDKWLKKEFPGRDMDPIETTKMNATEMWSAMTSQEFFLKDLGDGGLGLKQDQLLRVLAKHPMMSIEYVGGQPKHEYTRANLDAIDETGKHRGAMTLDLVAKLEDETIDSNPKGTQFKPKDGRDYFAVKQESLDLADAMARAYNKKDFSYTINDLINSAHLCHDLGVSGADPHIVRNDYYTKQPGYDKAAFEQEGDNMVSEFMWYNLTNPDIRGVTIQGELFSLDAAHELLRRYHYHHVKEALMTDMPELTIDMQTLNEYEFDYGKKEKLINKISTINTNTPVPAEIPIEIIDLFLDHSRGGKAGLEPFPPAGTATRPGLDVYLQTNYGWPVGKQVNTIKDLISLYVDDNPAIVTPEALELRSMLDNELYGIALNARGDKYEIYKAKTFKLGTETRGIKNLFHNPKAHGNPYATTIAGIDGSDKLAKRFLNKNVAELDGYIEAVEDGLKFSNEFVRRLAEISQYERMSYFRKTFWGDFKLWTQRLGNIAMLGSLIGAGLTGAPVFAALILGTMAVRIPAVLWMSKVESTYANRRVNALQLLDEFSGKMSMYKEIMGKPVSRLDKFMLNTAQSSNESKMEDLAKAGTPEGTYPSGDLAFKFANVVFGEKGLVGKMAGG